MEEKLYSLMDWREIETVVYSEENMPRTILGPRVVKEGVLIQCFFPGREKVSVKVKDQVLEMVQEDEAGFFACLLPGKSIPSYVSWWRRTGRSVSIEIPTPTPARLRGRTSRNLTTASTIRFMRSWGPIP